MGIFFTRTAAPTLTETLLTALNEPPPQNVQAAQTRAAQLAAAVQSPPRTVNKWGVIVALLFLCALFVGCIFTASNDKLADLYQALLHAFQVMLGLIPGALLGEQAAT